MATVVTNTGQARIAAATAGSPLVIDRMAVGDGNGSPVTPTASMTTLVNERARVSVIDQVVEGNVNRIRALFVPGATSYTIREAGLIATNGDLIAVISLSPQEMPTEAWATANSQAVEVSITIALVITEAGALVITVDTSSVYATITYVNNKVPAFATLAETNAGVVDNKIVAPREYQDSLDVHRNSRTDHPTGSRTLQGFLRIASAAESLAGVLETVAVPPKDLQTAINNLKNGVPAAGDTLKELYDLIISLQGVDTTIFNILNGLATFANMPVYPEIRDPTETHFGYLRYRIVPTQSGSVITIPTGKFIIHRGGKLYSTSDFSLANRQFTVPTTGSHHLRWYAPGHTNAPINTWPSGRFMLQSFSNPAYWAIGTNDQTNVWYDSDYDDMLVAHIQAVDITSNLTITPLVNKANHTFRPDGGGVPNDGPDKRSDIIGLNLGRTPKIFLSSWKFVQPAITSGNNLSILETEFVNREAAKISYTLKGATEMHWKAAVIMNDHHYDPSAYV